jgi:hypothetical protein
MKLSTELLKEIYNSVDQKLKAKIENEVPEINPKLEVGRWYKWNDSNTDTNVLLNITQTDSREIWAYGFVNNEFKHNCIFYSQKYNREAIENLTLATPEEVETALINEAKRTGFKKGVKCVFVNSENVRVIKGNMYNFNEDCNYLSLGYNVIFHKGKWATIINEPTQKELLQKQVDELKRQIDLL